MLLHHGHIRALHVVIVVVIIIIIIIVVVVVPAGSPSRGGDVMVYV